MDEEESVFHDLFRVTPKWMTDNDLDIAVSKVEERLKCLNSERRFRMEERNKALADWIEKQSNIERGE